MKCYLTYRLFPQVTNIFQLLAEDYRGCSFFGPFLSKVETGVKTLHLLRNQPLFQGKFWTFKNFRAAYGEIKGLSEAHLGLRFFREEMSIAL